MWWHQVEIIGPLSAKCIVRWAVYDTLGANTQADEPLIQSFDDLTFSNHKYDWVQSVISRVIFETVSSISHLVVYFDLVPDLNDRSITFLLDVYTELLWI